MVFEAIYYDNGTNGVQNQPNQLVLAKVKNNNHITAAVTDTKLNHTSKTNEKNVTAPILVTSVSSPITSVLQYNNSASSTNSGTIVKKPGIILLTQTSLSKLLSANDLNMLNNHANVIMNSNANTVSHAHTHQPDNSNRNKCNNTINSTNHSSSSQINNQLTSVLMINSTSTIETTAGIVTLTSTSASNRDAAVSADDTAKTNNQQVNINTLNRPQL